MSATNFSVYVPEYLVAQVDKRAAVFGRTRNAQWRHLLNLGLQYLDEGEPLPEMPEWDETWRQVTIRIPNDLLLEIRDSAEKSQRRVGPEALLIIFLAIEETTRRDMVVIRQMLERQGSAAR